ncbi:MAG: MBL fold metallo-hydrolase [Candidatus Binatia bacterium]
MKGKFLVTLLLTFVIGLGWSLAQAQVTITPLGSTPGEFCARDRAMLFEDPSGVRILIQPGRTVSGADDPRLGVVHAILLGHAHGDHIGDRIDVACDGSGGTSLAAGGIPNIVLIANEKNSAMLVGGELSGWLRERLLAAGEGGNGRCGGSVLTEVVRTTACADTLRPGATRELMLNGVPTGVKVSTVQAIHSNGIPGAFVNGGLPPGTTQYGGPETGYAIRFSNGLSVYWSDDTGIFAGMKFISDFYKVNLAILHIGDIFSMGPDEGAFATNKLIKPKTVIPQHANEVATTGGVVNPDTRTERFINQVKRRTKVIVPLSGVPISCDGKGRCTP